MEAHARSDMRDELREKRKAAVADAQAAVEDAHKKHRAAYKKVGGGDGDGGRMATKGTASAGMSGAGRTRAMMM